MKVEREAQGFALIAAILANVNRDRKKRSRAYRVDDFMPRPAAKRRQTPEQQAAILAGAAVRARG